MEKAHCHRIRVVFDFLPAFEDALACVRDGVIGVVDAAQALNPQAHELGEVFSDELLVVERPSSPVPTGVRHAGVVHEAPQVDGSLLEAALRSVREPT
ncbi:hypothetical protein Sgou_61820 [Streptomyces gougerotii]|uniref:Uncharacterized protein n=1 Tax=Streptomyces gougerotii TaxID=53448 RepID=A0ABQ1DGF7_9ACTN|nr:hypothetical protein [Streptomyces gougerotii]GFH81512.1 hypothetical protein Sgou_61820 [Streptomyces gougerotii]